MMNIPPLRAWIIVIVTSLGFLTLSYLFFERLGLFFGLLISILWSYGLLLHDHKTSIEHYRGIPLQGRDSWGLNEKIEAISETLGLQSPEFFITPHRHPLFLVSNSQWHSSQILLSYGLIRLLSKKELEAMITLAVITLKNRNTFFSSFFDRMALTWILVGEKFDQWLHVQQFRVFSTPTYMIAWIHLKLAYPRPLQMTSDSEAKQFLNDPQALAKALWKIQGYLDTHPLKTALPYRHESLLGAPESRRTAAQFIVPIEHRLVSLVGYYPI